MAGPVTLTRSQFAKTKAAAKPGATYERYLSYVNKARSKAPSSADPLAPSPVPAYTSLLKAVSKGLGGSVGPSASDEQTAQNLVDERVSPLITSLDDQAAQRAKDTANAIAGYTKTYADRLAGIPAAVKADLGAAANERSGLADSLSSFLASQGASGASALRSALARSDATPAALDYGNLQSAATGAQSAKGEAASGASAVDRLLTDKGLEAAYADTLPGIAALEGLRQTGLASGHINQDLASKTDQLVASEPGLIGDLANTLASERSSRAQNAAQLASSLYQNMSQRELQKAIAAAGFGVDYAKLNASASKDAADRSSRAAIAAANRQAQMARQIAHDNAAAALAKTKLSASRAASTQKKRDSLVTSSFQKAASAAARMKAGSYGSQTSGLNITSSGVTSGGTPWSKDRAYNALYAILDGSLRGYVTPTGLRQLTLRALSAGGYPVQAARAPGA